MRFFSLLGLAVWLATVAAFGAEREEALLAGAATGNVKMVEDALGKGAAPESRDATGLTPLAVAAKNGQVEVARILIAAGASVLTRSTRGSPPLCFAAENGNTEMIRLLMEDGADLEAPGSSGATPLIAAAIHGRLEAVNYLLDKGASIDKRSLKDTLGHEVNALWAAATHGYLDVVKTLLDRGALINAMTRNDNIVMEAAKIDNPEILRYLISRGADIHQKGGSDGGRTALYYAAFNGREENIKMLLEAGAHPTPGILDNVRLSSASAGHKMLTEAVIQEFPETAGALTRRTARDIAGVPRKEPSADGKYQ